MIEKNLLFYLTPKKDTEFLYADMTLRQSMEKFKEKNYSMIPVIDRETGEYVRTIRTNDLLDYVVKNHLDFSLLQNIPLRDIPSSWTIKAVGITEDVHKTFLLLMSQNYVPVIDARGIYIGIITRSKAMEVLYGDKV